MKYVTLAIGILIAWGMLLCTQQVLAEDLIQRSFEISAVHKIDANGGGDLEISIGDQERLEVIAPASIMEKIRIDAKSDTLRIRSKGDSLWQWTSKIDSDTHNVKYRLTIKQLSEIKASGNFQMRVLTPISSGDFNIKLSGASNLKLQQLTISQTLDVHYSGASELTLNQVHAKKLVARGSGASTMSIDGNIAEQDVHVNGASSYHAQLLQSQKADVHLSGASHAEIWVEQRLDANVSGASGLHYSGNPTTQIKSSGASDVSRIGDKP